VDSPHLSIERSVAFLLDGAELTPEEYAHLLSCDACRHEMVHAAAKELDKRLGTAG
jgi:hypothetical protein